MWREIALSLMSAIATLILYHTYGKIRIIHAVYAELQYLVTVIDVLLKNEVFEFKKIPKLESLRKLLENHYPTFHKINEESNGALFDLLIIGNVLIHIETNPVIYECITAIVGKPVSPTVSSDEDKLKRIRDLANRALNVLEKHKFRYFLFI